MPERLIKERRGLCQPLGGGHVKANKTQSSLVTQPYRIHLPLQEPQETRVRSLSREDPLEESMAIYSSILAWRIPWTEEPRGLQFMGSQTAGHD